MTICANTNPPQKSRKLNSISRVFSLIYHLHVQAQPLCSTANEGSEIVWVYGRLMNIALQINPLTF